jgi:type II secretion system protein G
MKLRCPYCKTELADPPAARCPACNKHMNLPSDLRPKESRQRKQALEKIRRDGDRERRAFGGPDASPGGKSGRLFFVLILLAGMGLLLVNQTNRVEKKGVSKEPPDITARELIALRIALQKYSADCGHYPVGARGLTLLITDTNTPNWKGPYLILLKNDPWTTPYRYSADATNVTLFSCGPDRIAGSPDDIYPATNWVDDESLF